MSEMDKACPNNVMRRNVIGGLLKDEKKRESNYKENFHSTWRDAVALTNEWADPFFGDVLQSKSRDDLCPRWAEINEAFDDLSHGEQTYVAALYSFYDPEEGQGLLIRAEVENFLEVFLILDQERKDALLRLIKFYYPWEAK
jgi:hypothetical protein